MIFRYDAKHKLVQVYARTYNSLGTIGTQAIP